MIFWKRSSSPLCVISWHGGAFVVDFAEKWIIGLNCRYKMCWVEQCNGPALGPTICPAPTLWKEARNAHRILNKSYWSAFLRFNFLNSFSSQKPESKQSSNLSVDGKDSSFSECCLWLFKDVGCQQYLEGSPVSGLY